MLIFDVMGQRLLMDAPLVVEDSNAYLEAQFNFHDEDWQTADDIWAHFEQDDKRIHLQVKNNRIEKSANLNLDRGYWKVYLHASSADGERITTNQVDLQVEKTGTMDGEVLPDIPLTAAEQISLTAAEAKQIAQSVRDDADNGVLNGDKGDPGFSPVLNVTEITGGHRITITDAEGSKSVDVMDGDGFSPIVSITPISGGYELTIQDKNGSKSIELLNGKKGDAGISPSISTQTIEGGNNVFITDADGTKKFFVPNGEDGVSPTVEIHDIIGGHNVQITDVDGTKSFDVLDGKDGEDGKDGDLSLPPPEQFWQTKLPYTGSPYSLTTMTYGNGRFLIPGQDNGEGVVFITCDFINFKRIVLTERWRYVKFVNGYFVLIGNLDENGLALESDKIKYSLDGETWTESTMPSSGEWIDISYGEGYYVAVAYDSDASAYSTDLNVWTAATMPAVKSWHSVCYGTGWFIAIAFDGSLMAVFHPGTLRWTSVGAFGTGYFFGVYFHKDRFYIPIAKTFGESTNEILVGNVLEFERKTLPVSAQWEGMAFGAGYGVVFAQNLDGINGTKYACYTKDDGETWTEIEMPVNTRRYTAAYGKGIFACIGMGFECCNLLDNY